jgi:hypothetical protein
MHHDVLINTKPWDSHPTASPEGLGTTYLRDITGGTKWDPSEPSCGLWPCAIPPKIQPGTERTPDTPKKIQNPPTFLTTHPYARVGSFSFPRGKMCAWSNTANDTTAPQPLTRFRSISHNINMYSHHIENVHPLRC